LLHRRRDRWAPAVAGRSNTGVIRSHPQPHASEPKPANGPAPPGRAATKRLRLGRNPLLAGAVLAVATLLAHGASLRDGSVLDDHWHQKGLREHGWSYSELMRTLTIEPARWLHHWWQDRPVRFEYGRPLFILAMKIVYVLLGGSRPVALHAFSITLHFVSACLVCYLAWRLTRHRLWSLCAGLLFVVYLHAQVTVAWPSSQNIVITTALLLACLLLYVRASGLSIGPDGTPGVDPSPLDRRAFAALLLIWLVALFVRENALILPVIAVAFDLSFGGWRHARARWPAYAVFVVLSTLFLLWRAGAVRTPMPDVYVRRPDGDLIGYALWCTAKLLHYLCTSVWLAPMTIGPTGRIHPWHEVPGDCLLMLTIVTVVLGGYLFVTRGIRGRWIWPLWILLAVLPVVPVVAAPHSGYLSGVGFAIGAVLGAARGPHRPRWTRPLAAGVVCFYLLAATVFAVVSRRQWTGTIAAERYTLEWIKRAPPAPPVRDVFFINLPFVNVYVVPALERELGRWFGDLRCHILTYSPDGYGVDARCYVVQLDDNRFSVEIDGWPYFSGFLGRFLIEALRSDGVLRSGQIVRTDTFDVYVGDVESQGVRRLIFAFPKPLTDPSYAFYLTSWDCGAVRLHFRCMSATASSNGASSDGPSADTTPVVPLAAVHDAEARLLGGDAGAAEVLFAALAGSEPMRERASMTLQTVAQAVAEATGSPLQNVLSAPSLSADEWNRVRCWWKAWVNERLVRDVWVGRQTLEPRHVQRRQVGDARRHIAQFLRTDLYLTGPPFAGPSWPSEAAARRHGGP